MAMVLDDNSRRDLVEALLPPELLGAETPVSGKVRSDGKVVKAAFRRTSAQIDKENKAKLELRRAFVQADRELKTNQKLSRHH